LALYSVCKEAVEKSQKQHKEAKSLQTNNMQALKKIASLKKKLVAKDETIRKLNIDVTTQKEKKKIALKKFSRGHRHKRHESSSDSSYDESDSLSDESTPPRHKSRRRKIKSVCRNNY